LQYFIAIRITFKKYRNNTFMKQKTTNSKEHLFEEISRKEAIKKIGSYAALTALGTFIILSPKTAQAQSISDGGYENSSGCNDGNCLTACGCVDKDANCDCVTTSPDPFQGDTNSKSNATFESKYKSRYNKE
jgi:hypothetical protein